MRRLVHALAVVGLLGSISGCASVGSAMGGNTSQTGEAWWVKNTGIGGPYGLIFSSKVFYCPAPPNGPAQCTEAKMVETAK